MDLGALVTTSDTKHHGSLKKPLLWTGQVGGLDLLTPGGVRKRPADETSLGLVADVVDSGGPRIVGGVLRAQH